MDTPQAVTAREKLNDLEGLDLQRLATHLGLSVATIYRWRSGAMAPKFNEAAPRIIVWHKRRHDVH